MSSHSFYHDWFDHLRHLIHNLNEAQRNAETTEEELLDLLNKVIVHYEKYYQVKMAVVARNVLDVFAAPSCTSVERSLMWISGWRPTTAFKLFMTESSLQFENNLANLFQGHEADIIQGVGEDVPALLQALTDGNLLQHSLDLFDELQLEVTKLEISISGELSDWQDSLCDLVGPDTEVDKKMEALFRIVSQADDLRLRTIKDLVDLLPPEHAVKFVIAAAELLFGIRTWGLEQDSTIE